MRGATLNTQQRTSSFWYCTAKHDTKRGKRSSSYYCPTYHNAAAIVPNTNTNTSAAITAVTIMRNLLVKETLTKPRTADKLGYHQYQYEPHRITGHLATAAAIPQQS